MTDPVACASLLVLSAVAPSAANNAAAGVDIIETESPYGLTITYKQIASDKTAVVGTHDFTISAVDWWGNTNTNTLTAKLLISDADCENKDTLTLTYNGNDAATYNLGDAAAEFPYSVTALVPDYCHYTIASTLIPGGISAHLTDDATNDKYLMAKVEGPGSLAGAYEVQATASTLHGKAVDLSDKLWKKTITVVDPCAADVLTYTATAPTDAEYQIGEPDKTIMTASAQISHDGGSTKDFCLTRVTATYTFGASGDDALFKNDYDSTGVLIFTQNYAVADAKTIVVTVQYKLDGADITGKTYNFNVVTKAVCGTPTFTVAAAQSSIPSVYIGRTMSVTWPEWTVSPSFCQFVYVVDTSAVFGSSASKFTVDGASATRTISIASGTSFT